MSTQDKIAAKKKARAAEVPEVQDLKEESMVSVRQEKKLQKIREKTQNKDTSVASKTMIKAQRKKIQELIDEEASARRAAERVEEESYSRFLIRLRDPGAKVRGDRGGRAITNARRLFKTDDTEPEQQKRIQLVTYRPTKRDLDGFECLQNLRPDLLVDIKRSASVITHRADSFPGLRKKQVDTYLAKTVLMAVGRDHQYNALSAYIRFRNNENLYVQPMDAHSMMARDYLIPCSGYAYACESPEEFKMQKKRYQKFRWAVNKLILCAIVSPLSIFAYRNCTRLTLESAIRRLGALEVEKNSSKKRDHKVRQQILVDASRVYMTFLSFIDSIRRSSDYAEHLFKGGPGQQFYLKAAQSLMNKKPKPTKFNPYTVTIDDLRQLDRSEIMTLLIMSGIEQNPGPIIQNENDDTVNIELMKALPFYSVGDNAAESRPEKTSIWDDAEFFLLFGIEQDPGPTIQPETDDTVKIDLNNAPSPHSVGDNAAESHSEITNPVSPAASPIPETTESPDRYQNRSATNLWIYVAILILLLFGLLIYCSGNLTFYVMVWLSYLGLFHPQMVGTKLFITLLDVVLDDEEFRSYACSISLIKHFLMQRFLGFVLCCSGTTRFAPIIVPMASLAWLFRANKSGTKIQTRLAGVTIYLLLVISGIEQNPGPPKKQGHTERAQKQKNRKPGVDKKLREEIQDLQGEIDAQEERIEEMKVELDVKQLPLAQHVDCSGNYLSDLDGFPIPMRYFPECLRHYTQEEVFKIYDECPSRTYLILMWHICSNFIDLSYELREFRDALLIIITYLTLPGLHYLVTFLRWIVAHIEVLCAKLPDEDSAIIKVASIGQEDEIALTISEIGELLSHKNHFRFNLVRVKSISHKSATNDDDCRPHTFKGTELRTNGMQDNLEITQSYFVYTKFGTRSVERSRQRNVRYVDFQSTAMMANLTYPIDWTRSNYLAACNATCNKAQNDVNINITAQGFAKRVAYSEAYFALTSINYWQKGYLNFSSPDGVSGRSGDTELAKSSWLKKHLL